MVPHGQQSIQWFSIGALAGMIVLWRVGIWYAANVPTHRVARGAAESEALLSRQVLLAIVVMVALVISKYLYLTSLSSYYTFFVIHKFGVSVQNAQLLLFLYLGAVAVGTVAGGAVVDRFGTRFVIWFSILGTLPFTLALPYVNLPVTAVLTVIIGLIIASVVLTLVAFGAQVILLGIAEFIARLLPLSADVARWVSLSRIAPGLALFVALYLVFYSLTPSKYRYSKCPKWPGALLTASWWVVVTALLPPILSLLGSYDLTYGSLAGVMIALIFFFFIGLGLVMGAHLNAALAEDPDEGLEGPARGADKEEPAT